MKIISNIISSIRNWRGGKELKFHPTLNKPIEFCFQIGAKRYYRFVNEYEIPQLRFKRLLNYYNEFQMKCDKDFLNDFADTILNCINVKPGDGIKLDKIITLCNELKYRLTWSFEPDQLYRLASAIFFVIKENVTDYDIKYNESKIERFKKKGMLLYF